MVTKVYITKEVKELEKILEKNPKQTGNHQKIGPLIEKRIWFADELIRKRNSLGFDSAQAYLNTGKGTHLTEEVKRVIHDIQKVESESLQEKQAEGNMHRQRAAFFLYGLQALLIIILFATIVVVVRAFTQRDRAQGELSESREWFSKTLLGIGDGVIATDDKGAVTFMNPMAEELTGWRFEEAKNKSLESIFEIVNETSRSIVENPVRKVLKEKHRVELANHTVLIRKDKTELAIADSAAPIFNNDNDLIGVVLVFRNVEAERKAEKEIKSARDRFFKIFDISPVAIVITTLSEGRILYFNKAYQQLFLKEGENVVGKTSIEIGIATPENRTKIVDQLKGSASGQAIETVLKNTSGELKHILLRGELIDMDNENCIVSCLTDITDRKNKELEIQKLNAELGKSIEQQKALNKELESFSYSVSHDLRAPLRSIDGYTRILQEDYGAKMDEEGHRIMKTIMNNAQKMNKLIDDLLSFSRLGKQSLDKVELDMNVIFSSIINDMKSHGPGEKTEFELKPLLNAWADRNLITQVIVNLLGNAIKYSSKKDHPRVEIGSYKEKDMHVYYIKDNGTGFDMAYYDKLFGIFQRLHSPSEFEGTGVGLAIVQRIVNRHQGRVWAEAVPDEGATFYFSLPIHT
jgi:PAS domain S-box-containing protein